MLYYIEHNAGTCIAFVDMGFVIPYRRYAPKGYTTPNTYRKILLCILWVVNTFNI